MAFFAFFTGANTVTFTVFSNFFADLHLLSINFSRELSYMAMRRSNYLQSTYSLIYFHALNRVCLTPHPLIATATPALMHA